MQGSSTTEQYSYDAVGNRLSDLTTSGWSYNPSNQLTSRPGFSYTYDNNGNTLTAAASSGTTTNTWDFENRLTQAAAPAATATMSYDPFGRRIAKNSALVAQTYYLYDGANLIAEVSSTGATIADYAQGLGIDQPLAITRAATKYYYNADGLGSITSLANTAGTLQPPRSKLVFWGATRKKDCGGCANHRITRSNLPCASRDQRSF